MVVPSFAVVPVGVPEGVPPLTFGFDEGEGEVPVSMCFGADRVSNTSPSVTALLLLSSLSPCLLPALVLSLLASFSRSFFRSATAAATCMVVGEACGRGV